jgi:hypothetical protein
LDDSSSFWEARSSAGFSTNTRHELEDGLSGHGAAVDLGIVDLQEKNGVLVAVLVGLC